MADSLAPRVIKRINKEFNALRSQPPEGVRVIVNEDDITDVKVWIRGPAETPYADGYFKIAFAFGPEYPTAPPRCTFSTKIFHPNVGPRGEICVNTLKKDWTSQHTLTEIVTVVKCLLIYPNPESALDEEAGRLLLEKYDEYFERAKMWTDIHGRKANPPPEFKVPGATDRADPRYPALDSTQATITKLDESNYGDLNSSSSLTPPINSLQPFAASAQANHLTSLTTDSNPTNRSQSNTDAGILKKHMGEGVHRAGMAVKEGENRKPARSTGSAPANPTKDVKDRRGRKRL